MVILVTILVNILFLCMVHYVSKQTMIATSELHKRQKINDKQFVLTLTGVSIGRLICLIGVIVNMIITWNL